MLTDISFEVQFGYPQRIIAGIDEVGRGCLAGPVVAAALVLPDQLDLNQDPWIAKISDSKLLTPLQRAELAPKIQRWARACAIGSASVEEIDRLNIHWASHLAMQRALNAIQPDHALVDGKFIPKDLSCSATAIVQGDRKCLSIAAASILAKVWRDQHLIELDKKYPGYGLAIHKGYSTPAHKQALARLRPTEIHRKSFAPVADLLGH